MNFESFISNKKLFLIRGIIALILGMLLVFYPSSTVGMIIKLIAAFLLAAGVSTLLFAYNSSGRVWKNIPAMVIVNVVVYMLFGLVLFSYPTFFLRLIAFLFGAVLLVCGLTQIGGLFYASRTSKVHIGFYMLPLIITISGVVLFFAPGLSVNMLTIIFGAEILLYGISELLTAWRLR